MRKLFLLSIFIIAGLQFAFAQMPALGTYTITTIETAGGNVTVIPSVVPNNTASIVAYTTTNFKGLMHVNPATGVVTVTNAYPAGTFNVTVKAFNGLSTVATTFTLIVNTTGCSQGLFSGTGILNVGTGPRFIAIGDFNNDSKQDFVTANGSTANVSVSLGDGSGGFGQIMNFPVGINPQSVAISDYNGDGKLDLAVANAGSNNVSILLGNGAGSFIGGTNVTVGVSPISIVTTDFNRDGKPDLAVTNGSSAGTVSIRLGDGAGNFTGTTNVTVGATPFSIVTADFNNDGNTDFATANNSGNNVSIRLGDGAGNFSAASDVIVGNTPVSIVAGDFNDDGNSDLAIANQFSANVSIRLGIGNGGFTGTTNIPFNLSGSRLPLALALGDYNGDYKQDFILTINGSDTVCVRLGDGAGSFTGNTNIAVGINPRSIATGDFNGDGKQDFITANAAVNTVSIRLGDANDIDVKGNNIVIADNDNTPDANDYTDFSSTPTGANRSRTFTIQNTGAVNLTVNNILSSGSDSSLFIVSGITLPYIVAAGASTTFTITFSPLTAGIKTATVNIINDNCDKATYDFAITGASCTASDPSNIWLGNTSDWNLPTNWSLNFVPLECTKVVVNAGVPFMPEITSPTSSCYSIILNNAATIIVKTGGHLNITANK